jgi:hypothetical protein
MVAQANGRCNFGHVLAAHKLRANTGQLAFLPIGMGKEQRLAYNQTQDRVAEKLHALIVSSVAIVFAHGGLPIGGLLVGERAMSEGAHQQLGPGKAMAQRRFQFRQSCFHMHLDQVES